MKFSKATQQYVDHDAIRAVNKLMLGAVWLVVVLYLLTFLPGIDRIIPQTSITFAALVSTIGTVVLVALLAFLAPRTAGLLQAVDGPRRVTENVASATYWFVLLLAVLVAHRGFAPIAHPYLGNGVWAYDMVFLVIALPAVVFMGARLYASLDPSSELLADKIVRSES